MKSVNDVKEAPKYDIQLTTVDSVEAVEQISDTKWSPGIIVRLAVDDSSAKSPFSIKFGAKKDEWMKIMDCIQYHKMEFRGVSFHIGSSSSDPNAFRDAILQCRSFQNMVNKEIHTVDIGGGFLPEELIFRKSANAINNQKRKWEEDKTAPKKWIAEPGRFFSNPSQILYLPIVFCKENNENRRYIVDDSLYGQFTNIVFDHCHPQFIVLDKNYEKVIRGKTEKDSLFFGKTCDSMDFIALQKNSPKYEVGDILVFPNMGAYTNASASNFNGFNQPTKIYTKKQVDIKTYNDNSVIYPISVKSEVSLSISNEL
jgi:ornithine decarboxylase